MQVRQYVTMDHLWTARHAARLCGELEPQLQPNDPKVVHCSLAMTAIFFGAAFLEALVNEVILDVIDPAPGGPSARVEGIPADPNTIAAFEDIWKRERRLGPLGKYRETLAAVAVNRAKARPFTETRDPYRSAKLLIRFRNYLALSANPATIKRAMATARQREPVILTPAEIAALADAIKPAKYRALVLIAAWCGLRFGELIGLQRNDIGAGAATITVARGIVHRNGCHEGTPKSERGRSVVVPEHIRGEVKHHLDTYVGGAAEALLFAPANGGCHLNDQVFRERFNIALAAIGREGVRVHDLRHTAGTMTALTGATLAEIMARLGHLTPKAAMLYQQVRAAPRPSPRA